MYFLNGIFCIVIPGTGQIICLFSKTVVYSIFLKKEKNVKEVRKANLCRLVEQALDKRWLLTSPRGKPAWVQNTVSLYRTRSSTPRILEGKIALEHIDEADVVHFLRPELSTSGRV